jgi:hypothetical protein
MRVTQLREGVSLAVEALAKLRIACERGWQNLDGDGPSETGIVRLVDLTHATGAEERKDFVWTKGGASVKRHARVPVRAPSVR